MMKKLLFASLTIFISTNFNAQSCSPDPLYADSIYGVWPDTTENLPPAIQNLFYTTNLDFAIPSTVTADLAAGNPLGSLLLGNTINYFKVDSVSGLNSVNLQLVCGTSNCQYLGGSKGCANIYGTPLQTGTFPLKIYITANIATLLGSANFPTTFDGYKVVVGIAGNIESSIESITVAPNPTNDKLKINGITPSRLAKSIAIVNIEGQTLLEKEVENVQDISFDLQETNSGIYFVKITFENSIETIRFVKN
jgi:hypothetical protein